jgi:hypothetical protein
VFILVAAGGNVEKKGSGVQGFKGDNQRKRGTLNDELVKSPLTVIPANPGSGPGQALVSRTI